MADDLQSDSLVAIADGIRSERRGAAERAAADEQAEASEPPRPGDRFRARELRGTPSLVVDAPTRRLDIFEATMAAASEQHAEAAADDVLGEPTETRPPHPAG